MNTPPTISSGRPSVPGKRRRTTTIRPIAAMKRSPLVGRPARSAKLRLEEPQVQAADDRQRGRAPSRTTGCGRVPTRLGQWKGERGEQQPECEVELARLRVADRQRHAGAPRQPERQVRCDVELEQRPHEREVAMISLPEKPAGWRPPVSMSATNQVQFVLRQVLVRHPGAVPSCYVTCASRTGLPE